MNFFQKQRAAGKGFRKHPQDLIDSALERVDQGWSVNEVARDIGLNESTVRWWRDSRARRERLRGELLCEDAAR